MAFNLNLFAVTAVPQIVKAIPWNTASTTELKKYSSTFEEQTKLFLGFNRSFSTTLLYELLGFNFGELRDMVRRKST